MKLDMVNLKGNLKFRTFIGFTVLLFAYKLFLYNPDSWIYILINELLVGITVVSLITYLMDLIHSRVVNPISLVMNIGILNAILFFLFILSGDILGRLFKIAAGSLQSQGILNNIIAFAYSYIILGSTVIVFLILRELYFLKQKKSVGLYFNTMTVFFVLASLGSFLKQIPDLDYIRDTFFIISILLIVVNSIKISWIAFIVKKEKISLLILSVLISILFVVNLVNSASQSSNSQILSAFSPVMSQFLTMLMIYGAIYFSILFFTTLFHIPTAEAFDRKAKEVTFLQYFSKLITQSTDFKELASTVTDITTKVSSAQAAWIAWKENDEYKTIAVKGIGYYDSNLLTDFIFKKKLYNEEGKSFFIDLKSLKNKPQLSENFCSVACEPLRTHDELKGYLMAAAKADNVFDEEDKNAMDTFSDYASLAIENYRLLEESIEKERMEKELDVAREIQRKILPAQSPILDKLNISSLFIPAFEVGGDYYDFFEIDKDKFGFVIADVSGKGISAAFIMAEIKGIFESLSKTIQSPKDILIKANEILKRTLDRKNFVSAAYGLINLKEETLSIARAGHCPILLIRNNVAESIRPSGIGLGLDFGPNFSDSLDEKIIKLEDNDILVLYTDGITEAKNSMLEDFGTKHFEEVLLENSGKNADEISGRVIGEVTLFSQNNPQHDDITLVILKWKQKLKNDGVQEWQNSAPQLKTQVM